MKSIIEVIAWMALLAAVGCATHQNQGGTAESQSSGQDTGNSMAPASPGPKVEPGGIPDNGSFMNENGLNTDMLDEEGDWDDSNAMSNPGMDEEMEEEGWSSSPDSDNTDLDNPGWSLDNIEGSAAESADDSSLETPDEAAGGELLESQTDTAEDSGTIDAQPDNSGDSDSDSIDEVPDLILV